MDFKNSQVPDQTQRMLASYGTRLEYDPCAKCTVIDLSATDVSDRELAELIYDPGFAKLDLARTNIF